MQRVRDKAAPVVTGSADPTAPDAAGGIVRVPPGPYFKDGPAQGRLPGLEDVNFGGKIEIAVFPRTPAPPHLSTSIWLYDGMAASLLALHPDFPADFSAPSPPRYAIVDAGSAGRGMVASVDLATGDTIARERPLALFPVAIAMDMNDARRVYEAVVASMHIENQRVLRALKNWKGADRAPFYLKGVVDTNAIGVGALPGNKGLYGGLARDICRVNHSCSPNARHSFDLRTNSFVLRAVRPIRKGEEVYISYLHNPATLRKDRQEELLRRYGFVCSCKYCGLTGQESFDSDSNRAIIYIRWDDRELDEALFAQWLAEGAPKTRPTAFEELALKLNGFRMAELAWTTMLREGCISDNLWEPVLARLVKAHSVLKDEKKVRYYATKAAELAVAFEAGSEREWEAVAKNPTKTDWWGKRNRALAT
ncbi:SET domain-containing protein [Polyporus arcularius HHB13444]|uniref:SET domain-containing protein n=1 Tax=Polyporus arcularius HHB13444 TaxID=1314778 RepID=A0A5C3PLN9_9APHY|nr:SET domain-containing protein [Polyporus arcularius HHB13444]